MLEGGEISVEGGDLGDGENSRGSPRENIGKEGRGVIEGNRVAAEALDPLIALKYFFVNSAIFLKRKVKET